MGNWLASELLRTERVESVVQVSTSAGRTLFNYEIFGTASQVLENGKSRYYPVDLAEVLQRIRTSPDKVAIVGVPCFVKAIRLMGRADPALDAKIGYTIGLVCGHLKTTAFAEMFSWQMGVPPGHLQSIDFRVKNESGRADNYSIKVTGSDLKGRAVTKIAQNKSLFGYLWGHGFFKYRACDYCDDVLAELADVAVGDAWLPGYAQDSMGTNVVISRSADIDAMIRAAIDEDRLRMDVITADQVARSQDAGLRHRRLGLSVRLEDKRRAGRWAPPKRVQPGSDNLNKRQRWVYRIREKMSERSHYAFAKAVKSGRFSTFKRQMKPWMDVHDFVNRSISWKALLKRLMFSPFIK